MKNVLLALVFAFVGCGTLDDDAPIKTESEVVWPSCPNKIVQANLCPNGNQLQCWNAGQCGNVSCPVQVWGCSYLYNYFGHKLRLNCVQYCQ